MTDTTIQGFVFAITDNSSKIEQFIELMMPLGLVEMARTGERRRMIHSWHPDN